MKKISLKDLSPKAILSREELKEVQGGWIVCADGVTLCPDGYQCDDSSGTTLCKTDGPSNCCLNELWNATGQYQETCGLQYASASFACEERRKSQTSDYACSVTCG